MGKIVDVEMLSDKITKVKVAIGYEVWEVFSYYCRKVGRLTAKKDEFYEFMEQVVSSKISGITLTFFAML